MELADVQRGEKLYTLREVAKFMEIAVPTLQRMVRDGRIDAYSMSSTDKPLYRFTAKMVQDYYDKLKEQNVVKPV